MGFFIDRLKSAIGTFQIEGNGFYLPAKIRDKEIYVTQIVATGSSVAVSLPVTYENLAIVYCFESNSHAPANVISIEISSGIQSVNFQYLADVPHVKITGDMNSVEEAFEKLNPEKCILEIYDNQNYSTCSDGRSIINEHGVLVYYCSLGDEVLKIPEGVRNIGRNCLPKGKSFFLPASFDFVLGDVYETKDLFDRFCDLIERYKVKEIKTTANNPVWQYNNGFFHDKKNNNFWKNISENTTVIHLSGLTYPLSFRGQNFGKINRVDLAGDYCINLTGRKQISDAISSLRYVLGLFPNLEDVTIGNKNLDWINKKGLIIYKKLNTIIFALPLITNIICPDGSQLLNWEVLKNCHEVRFSDNENFGFDSTDPMFLKNISNQLKKLSNLRRVQISQENKNLGIVGNFLINKKQQCAFYPFDNIGKEVIIPSKELVFWQGFDSHFSVRARSVSFNSKENSVRSRYGLLRYNLDSLSECCQMYPQVEKLVFPSDFDFSRLLCQEEIVNEDLKLLETVDEKDLFPLIKWTSLPSNTLINDKYHEYIDCLLVLVIKQFCNLKTIQFGVNNYYENRNGLIINKMTRKVLMILPEMENVIIPPDLWLDELTVFGLRGNRPLSVVFPIEQYKDSSWLGYHLPFNHKYYVPIQWLLNNQQLRNRGNLIGYDRFGIVPEEESKSSTYRIRKRATKAQIQLPFEEMNKDYYIRDASIKKSSEKEIEEGDIICCKLNSVVSVMNTFPCINKGHKMIRVFLEILIKEKSESKPFKMKLEAYYCKQCERIFMYTTEYSLIKKYIDGYNYHVFNRFLVNGHNEGFSDNPVSWASESILKEAGYEVNQNSSLNQKERLDILIDLNKRGVPYHTIISYINVFINVIGASWSKNMMRPVERWKSDLEAIKELYFKGILN